MELITQSTATAFINAPVKTINLTEWLFKLREDEYCACSKDHIAAGSSVTIDNKRTSVNVEIIAGNLLVQHYIEVIGKNDLCRVKSISDSFTQGNRTSLIIEWEIKVEKLTDSSCTFVNHVEIGFTNDFKSSLQAAGITDIDAVKKSMGINLAVHNAEETPNFALNIEQKALSGIWK